jgi:hypothetical protein
MKHKISAGLGIVFALSTVLSSSAAAQTSSQAPDSSLGDYARKVHKDTGTGTAKSKPKVFDNDNLPKDDKISIVGQPASTTADAAAADTNSKAAAPADANAKSPASADASSKTPAAPDAKTATPAAATTPANEDQAKKQAAWKAWQEKLAAQKEQIDLNSRELDVTQREYQLRAAAMYADTGNRLRNEAQWDKQDAEYKQKIADKQKAVDDAKQRLTDMQEEARKAGVPSSMLD